MSMDNAKKFVELVNAGNGGIANELDAAFKSFTGDRKDQQEVYDSIIAPIARKNGFEITFEEAKSFMYTSEDVPAEGIELTDEELDQVAGGWKCCKFW